MEMAVRAVSGSTEFQIILEGHGAEWSRQKWYGWNPHILGSSKHHPELPADASGHDNPIQFDLTALLSRDFGMLSSDDSRNLYISVAIHNDPACGGDRPKGQNQDIQTPQ